METILQKTSKENLERSLKRVKWWKSKRTDAEVEAAINGLNIIHCVRDENIMQVWRTQVLKVKIELEADNVRMTNASTDYIQGFDQYVSMGIGRPWFEHGPYAFSFGLEHMPKESLVFDCDPWQLEADEMMKKFLYKDDFVQLQREVLKRNLYQINKNLYIKLPWKSNLHKLIKRNLYNYELKCAGNLDINDADEFTCYAMIDYFLNYFVNTLYRPVFAFFWLAIILITAGVRAL